MRGQVNDWYAVDLKQPINGLSSGWVRSTDVVPVKVASKPKISKSAMDRIYETIVKKASEVKEKYKDNPHLRVSGFSIKVSFPPSVSLDFDFKE